MAKAEPSDKTKSTASSLKSGVNPKSSPADSQLNSPQEILGAIYELMVKTREETVKTRELEQKLQTDKKKQDDTQHQEILKALTVRRKPKRVIRREKKAEEKAAKREPEPTKAPEKKPTEKPAETKKVEEKAKTEGEKAKQTAEKESKSVKKQVDKEAKVAKKKAEPIKEKPAEAPKKAEPAPKPPETPAPTATSTATKVSGGIALAAAASASMAAGPLAENIVAHESKVSSPQKGKKTKWKNSTEYNAYNKGTEGKKIISADFDKNGESVIDFSKMSIEEYLRRGSLKSGDPDKILAMGRYQIIPETMKEIVDKLKLDPKTTFLNKETQDYLFMAGLIGQKRPLVKRYIDGDINVTRDQAIMQLAQEFASIGVPYDTTYKGKSIKRGQSFYSQNSKSGLALNPPEEVGKALDAQRALNLKEKQTPTTVPPSPNTGNQIDQSSQENKNLKDEMVKNKATTTVNTQNTNVQQGSQPAPQQKVDDRPAILRKQNG